jgi:ketosteroid isomerase-like protein
MNPEHVIRTYLSCLEEGDSGKILQLFTRDAVVISPLYGEIGAADFFLELLKDTLESKITLEDISRSPSVTYRFAAHFTYDWKLRDGGNVKFLCTDVFDFDESSGKIRRLSIIYDSRQAKNAFDTLKGRG